MNRFLTVSLNVNIIIFKISGKGNDELQQLTNLKNAGSCISIERKYEIKSFVECSNNYIFLLGSLGQIHRLVVRGQNLEMSEKVAKRLAKSCDHW